jgi:hypothetical protein
MAGLEGFIREIWANDVRLGLQRKTVFGNVVNHDYEGEIRKGGDTVRASGISNVTVGTYVKNVDMDVQRLEDDAQLITISEADYFNCVVDAVDIALGNPKVVEAGMVNAQGQLKNAMDLFIAGLYGGASASNLIGSTASPKLPNNTDGDAQNVVKLMTLARQALTKSDASADDRWIVVSPEYYSLLLNDKRFSAVDQSGSEAGLRQGFVGRCMGFEVYESNNVECIEDGDGSHDVFKAMFGTMEAISFADVVNNVRTYEPEKTMGVGFSGLHLYGGKVVEPGALGVLSYYTT